MSRLAEVVRGAGEQTVEAGSADQTARNQAKTIQLQLVAVVTGNVLHSLKEERKNEIEVARETVSRTWTVYDQSHQVPSSCKSESGLDSPYSSESDEVDSDDEH